MTIIDKAISKIENTDRLAFTLAGGIGPWIVPVASALVFAYAYQSSIAEELGLLSYAGAAAIAVGLIVAGAYSSHVAIKKPVAWVLVVSYIALEIVGLWAMNIERGVSVVGTVAALMTLIVYLSRAIERDVQETEAKQKEEEAETDQRERETEAEAIEFKREQARQRARDKKEFRLAEIASETKVRLAETFPKQSETFGNVSETNGKLPNWLPKQPKDKKEFLAIFRNGKTHLLEPLTGPEIREAVEIIGTSRTALNWKKEALNGG